MQTLQIFNDFKGLKSLAALLILEGCRMHIYLTRLNPLLKVGRRPDGGGA